MNDSLEVENIGMDVYANSSSANMLLITISS